MITEKELDEGILQCTLGEPTPDKMVKLASYYYIRNHLFGKTEHLEPNMEYSREQRQTEKFYTGGNYLLSAFHKDSEKTAAIIEEVMQAVKLLQPKMYESTMRKLKEV